MRKPRPGRIAANQPPREVLTLRLRSDGDPDGIPGASLPRGPPPAESFRASGPRTKTSPDLERLERS